jgi:tetratricopeptide (TPR) repeat protein
MEKWVERKAGLLSILGRYDESALIHTSLVKGDDARVRSLEELGRIHYILNNHEKAIEFFDKVLCREPMNSKVILNKSMAYFSSSRYEKAIFCLEQILSNDPFYFHAQYQKARIQKILGNVKQSLDILSRITKSNSDFKIVISQDLVFDDLKDIEIFEKKE